MLPHHDGGNASFLTPSLLDDPLSGEHMRRTSPRTVTTTRRHKMYQGFLLRDAGDFESTTTYYDLLAIARDACSHQTNRSSLAVEEVARWVGENLRYALSLIRERGGSYVTLGGMLGSRDPLHCLTAVHLADELLSARPGVEMIPELRAWTEERLFDRVLDEVTGEGWASTRERHEVGVRGINNDFLIGHNITLLHGGWQGGRGRVIEPICFTLDTPSGADYEEWLWRAWRRPAITRSPRGAQSRISV